VRLDFREGKIYGGQGATPAIAFARSADLAADHEIWCGRGDARSAANPSEQSPAEAASFRRGAVRSRSTAPHDSSTLPPTSGSA